MSVEPCLQLHRPAANQERPVNLPAAASAAKEALLIAARQASAMCAVSLATWWRWDAAGRMPAGVKIGGTKRWRADELRSWISSGCPDRAHWNVMQGRGQGR
jgi:predicted DNA-binding transcriptional regulator AlpA